MKEGIGCLVVLALILLGWMGLMTIKSWWLGGEYDTIEISEEAYLCLNNEVESSRMNQKDDDYKSYMANWGDRLFLIEKIQYIFVPTSDEIVNVPIRPNKEFLDSLNYEVVREGYKVSFLRGDNFFRSLGWLPTKRNKDSELGNVPDYYRQLSSNTFGAYYCEGSTAAYTIPYEEDCEMESYTGNFKQKFYAEVTRSCNKTKTDGIVEYFERMYDLDREYEKQEKAKSVFGDSYESDFKSIEREYEINKDYKEAQEAIDKEYDD